MSYTTYISDAIGIDRTIIPVDNVHHFLQTTNKRGDSVPLWQTVGISVRIAGTNYKVVNARVHADNRTKTPRGQSGFLILEEEVSSEDGRIGALVTLHGPIKTVTVKA